MKKHWRVKLVQNDQVITTLHCADFMHGWRVFERERANHDKRTTIYLCWAEEERYANQAIPDEAHTSEKSEGWMGLK